MVVDGRVFGVLEILVVGVLTLIVIQGIEECIVLGLVQVCRGLFACGCSCCTS